MHARLRPLDADGDSRAAGTNEISGLPLQELEVARTPANLCVVAMMDRNRLATRDRLCRGDLRGAHVAVCYPTYADVVRSSVMQLFGEDLGLAFDLVAIDSMRSLAFVDFGEHIFVCDEATAQTYLSKRTDVKVYREVEGVTMERGGSLVWRTDNPNPAVPAFVERFLGVG